MIYFYPVYLAYCIWLAVAVVRHQLPVRPQNTTIPLEVK